MKIVIIGGGFAGINLAKELLNQKDIEVILVDKNNLSGRNCVSRTFKY